MLNFPSAAFETNELATKGKSFTLSWLCDPFFHSSIFLQLHQLPSLFITHVACTTYYIYYSTHREYYHTSIAHRCQVTAHRYLFQSFHTRTRCTSFELYRQFSSVQL